MLPQNSFICGHTAAGVCAKVSVWGQMYVSMLPSSRGQLVKHRCTKWLVSVYWCMSVLRRQVLRLNGRDSVCQLRGRWEMDSADESCDALLPNLAPVHIPGVRASALVQRATYECSDAWRCCQLPVKALALSLYILVVELRQNIRRLRISLCNSLCILYCCTVCTTACMNLFCTFTSIYIYIFYLYIHT
jgi:hypothetical protein